MLLYAAVKTRPGHAGGHLCLAGWANDQTGPVLAPAEITLSCGAKPLTHWLRLVIDPASASLTAEASGGSGHYFRLADATLRPLPAWPPDVAFARMTLARGDAYVAVSPGARGLASDVALARFLHMRDHFNAERLAESLLTFLSEESGQRDLAEDATVVVIEAR